METLFKGLFLTFTHAKVSYSIFYTYINHTDGKLPMDETQKKAQDKEFYTLADKFIDIANDECESKDPSFVGSAMLFATARFSAFVVASQAQDKDSYEAELESATEFFTAEFDRMLKQNMEDYKTAFTQQDEARYEYLMKKD